uniref:ER membrane protein complex subunit 7 n=1 Tax=Cacopsylla melanoneura TaxID=428564 RepID=A0A8D8QUJ5_9HEMI
MNYLFLVTVVILFCAVRSQEVDSLQEKHDIEGRVLAPTNDPSWIGSTQVYIRGGQYIGFLRDDGSFTIKNVPTGSYVLEVVNPDFMFDPIRVEINSKGKFRARKVDYIQLSKITQLPYPLKLKTVGKIKYFQTREQWRATDLLFNPMVLMMVAPLFLIMILPRLMNDPETRKEMEQLQSMTKLDVPEMSEMLTSYFGGAPKKPKAAVKPKPSASKLQAGSSSG